ncbi:uncharacterized protein [Periplaneta americana]|uniref:uncharacterized protein isoform X2 n=1 Tax=Periplaneta americana TaxID=6978 RepID=UPI0037E7435E
MMPLFFLIIVSSFGTFCIGDKAEKRQSFGGSDVLGPLLSGGQFLGQLGQHLQQGISQYTGNFPVGEYSPQFLNQFPGFLGQQPGGQYFTQGQNPYGQQSSVIGALTSIAKYDDLKCVPRLLCEVAAGGRPGYTSGKQDYVIPFVNRDTLMSLLTLINFDTTSPLMVFGRAILLGMTTKGSPSTCFSAYPTCPRDPDRLVDYLNNHNGGFFRFFGTNQPYYPPYHQGRIQNSLSRFTTTGRPQDTRGTQGNRGQTPLQFPKTYQISTSLKPPSLNTIRDTDYFRREPSGNRLSVVFPGNGNRHSKGLLDPKDNTDSALKTISFPIEDGQSQSFFIDRPPLKQNKLAIPMQFPDKTGTGDLKLDVNDINGPVISVAAPVFGGHFIALDRKETLKFPEDGGSSNIKKRDNVAQMKFPSTAQENSLDVERHRKELQSFKFPPPDKTGSQK